MVAALKRMAIELGRTPTRAEFEQATEGSQYKLRTQFGGSYRVLVQAAGLEPNDSTAKKKKKITNAVFERDLESVISSRKQPFHIERGPYPSIAAISDIHFPWPNPRVLEKFYRRIDKYKHENVLVVGDAWDMYAHAKFPRSHNVFTPRQEHEISRKMNEEFWREVKIANSKARLVQMLGNHDARPLKKVLTCYPEAEDWVINGLTEAFSFDGVQTIIDPREELFIDDVMIHHGYFGKIGDHRDFAFHNSINGHIHLAGVSYRKVRGQTLFELNCGLAGDPTGKGLTYTPQKIVRWTGTFGEVDEDGARVIVC